ncbi:hypothetical protein H4R18_005439 [Coemansia javaensis]|uniref:Uncharacterized protein n=1 Tax=Coemansia javaensis TaxID=2761396 RepID=A0A9W8H6D4_9FUNG|nr:hypothetical protein H4R18_005439 [Coemansia javaensis]
MRLSYTVAAAALLLAASVASSPVAVPLGHVAKRDAGTTSCTNNKCEKPGKSRYYSVCKNGEAVRKKCPKSTDVCHEIDGYRSCGPKHDNVGDKIDSIVLEGSTSPKDKCPTGSGKCKRDSGSSEEYMCKDEPDKKYTCSEGSMCYDDDKYGFICKPKPATSTNPSDKCLKGSGKCKDSGSSNKYTCDDEPGKKYTCSEDSICFDDDKDGFICKAKPASSTNPSDKCPTGSGKCKKDSGSSNKYTCDDKPDEKFTCSGDSMCFDDDTNGFVCKAKPASSTNPSDKCPTGSGKCKKDSGSSNKYTCDDKPDEKFTCSGDSMCYDDDTNGFICKA